MLQVLEKSGPSSLRGFTNQKEGITSQLQDQDFSVSHLFLYIDVVFLFSVLNISSLRDNFLLKWVVDL